MYYSVSLPGIFFLLSYPIFFLRGLKKTFKNQNGFWLWHQQPGSFLFRIPFIFLPTCFILTGIMMYRYGMTLLSYFLLHVMDYSSGYFPCARWKGCLRNILAVKQLRFL